MNLGVKPEHDLASQGIGDAEPAHRKASIDYRRGRVRLKGFVQSEFAEALNCK